MTRSGAADARANGPYNVRERINQTRIDCQQVREGVGPNGDFCIDFHQRFALADAIRGCNLIEESNPLFVEDPVRAEATMASNLTCVKSKPYLRR